MIEGDDSQESQGIGSPDSIPPEDAEVDDMSSIISDCAADSLRRSYPISHTRDRLLFDNYCEAVTQTPDAPFSVTRPPSTSGLRHSRGGDLVRHYHRAVIDHISNANLSDMSELRSEICERIQRRATYQLSSYGTMTIGLDEPPLNLYSSFTVSLYLVIYQDGRFTFSSAAPGLGISGMIDEDEGRSLLFYVSRGILRPGLLPPLLDLKLTWYDGSLICEVTDARRTLGRTIRTQLRVAHEDVVAFGIDVEQQVLLAQHPLLCLDPTTQVGNLARVALNDRQRWEPSEMGGESKMLFVARRCPEIFFKAERRQAPHRITREQEDEYRQQMIEKLLAIDRS
jgi:hypothetical protein